MTTFRESKSLQRQARQKILTRAQGSSPDYSGGLLVKNGSQTVYASVMTTNRGEKALSRMNLIFWGSMALQFVAGVAIFAGLLARGSRHHWGIWFTIAGWTTFFSGYVIR